MWVTCPPGDTQQGQSEHGFTSNTGKSLDSKITYIDPLRAHLQNNRPGHASVMRRTLQPDKLTNTVIRPSQHSSLDQRIRTAEISSTPHLIR